MSSALMEAPAVRVVTGDELTLIKQTIAAGATDAELKLFLFDCARQGVHPLDRLLFFTKRGGKYTPVTSIDFMRTRAAETGEYAGSDDAWFPPSPASPPPLATVTVWRLVQGQRCAFTATARWTEYCPGAGQDHMWRKMPHTMLGKCAEALALRKGFPRQLAGLYAREEMDQTDTPPAPARAVVTQVAAPPPPDVHVETGEELPEGALWVTSVETMPTKNPNVVKGLINFSDGIVRSTINTALINAAILCQENHTPVWVEGKTTKWGVDLTKLTPAMSAAEVEGTRFDPDGDAA